MNQETPTPALAGSPRLPARFWTAVQVGQPSECWHWTGPQTPRGFGRFRINGETWSAHRFAYEALVSPIQDRRELVHSCLNKLCVNPGHLAVRDGVRLPDNPKVPVADRVLARLSETTDGCWNWTGPQKSNTGYPQDVEMGGRGSRRVTPYRVMYEFFVADVPGGLHLDHLCRNRICCNPWHLEPVTLAENTRRGFASTIVANRTNRCLRGHDFTPENTINKRDGTRQCRRCKDDWRRSRAA